MSDADATALLKMDINLPAENKSRDNLQRMDALCSILLPLNHPFSRYISDHLKELEAYFPRWEQLEVKETGIQSAKGVLHLQYLTLRCSHC